MLLLGLFRGSHEDSSSPPTQLHRTTPAHALHFVDVVPVQLLVSCSPTADAVECRAAK